MQKIETLLSQHDLRLLLLAATICIVGSWIALTLMQQAQAKSGRLRTRWLLATAISLGVTIWCTHFTAMMAFSPGVFVELDMQLTMVSLVVAVLTAALAIWMGLGKSFRFAPEIGGMFAGLGVSSMHYTGMMAYRLTSPVTWNTPLLAASVGFAVLFGSFAFNRILCSPERASDAIGKLAFSVAILTLHFTGMAAMDYVCSGNVAYDGPDTFTPMGIAIGTVGLLTIINSLATQLIETRGSRESLQRLQHLALTDMLTGLPNRAHFNEVFDDMLHTCEKNAGRLAVIGIDLDRFKEINDLRGHAAGDEALRIVGKRLSGLATAKRFFARLGGDEFAAVIAFDDEQQLLELVARIEELLFLPLSIFGLEASTGASIGIAIFPEHGSDRERLMANADIAMYRAKKAPGQTTCFFEAGMESAAHARHELSHDLRRALERDQFQLYYQVQTSIETGQPLGYEALLRWKHPEKGFVSPAIFIPIAEETGDIVAIGEWVLRTACREAAKWTLPHKVSVNISPVQFSNAGLVQLLLSILMETQLPANRLELEITETAIIEDKVRTLHMLRQIRGIGVTVAIDDFGIGYSSLDTLRSFPFDKIKLDQSFIRELDQHPQSKAIIRAVMALGKSMSIPVLAEGVETMTQLRMLEEEGCHQAQGYLLGKPQPLSSANEPQPASIAPPRPTGVVSAVEAPRLAQN